MHVFVFIGLQCNDQCPRTQSVRTRSLSGLHMVNMGRSEALDAAGSPCDRLP